MTESEWQSCTDLTPMLDFLLKCERNRKALDWIEKKLRR